MAADGEERVGSDHQRPASGVRGGACCCPEADRRENRNRALAPEGSCAIDPCRDAVADHADPGRPAKKPGGSLKCGQVFLLALGKNRPPWALSTIRELTVVAPEAYEMNNVTRMGYAPILYSSRKYSHG